MDENLGYGLALEGLAAVETHFLDQEKKGK